MPLTATQEAFLVRFLYVEKKPRGVFKKRDDEQKANDRAKEAFKKFQEKEAKADTALGKLEGLLIAPKTTQRYQTQLEATQKIVKDAQGQAKDAEPEIQRAAERMEEITTSLKEDIGKIEAYKTALATAKGLVPAVTALNVAGEKTFDDPLKTLIADVERMVLDQERFEAASGQLANAATLQKTQLKEGKAFQEARQKYLDGLPKAKAQCGKVAVLNLPGHPDPFEGPVKDLIDAAEVAARAFDYVKANESLEEVEGKCKEQTKAAKEFKENQLKAAEHEPVYTDKKRRVQAAIDELKVLPGTAEQVTKLTNLIVEAEKLLVPVEKADYKAAYDQLKGLSGTLAEGKKAAAKFTTSAGNEGFQTARAAAEKALKDFTPLADLSQPGRIQDARKKIDAALVAIDQAKNTDKDKVATAQAKELNTLAGDLNQDVLRLGQVQKDCVKKKSDVSTALFGELRQIMQADKYQPYLEKFTAASTLIGVQQYDNGLLAMTSLETDLTGLQEYRNHFATWQRYAKIVADNKDNFAALKAMPMGPVSNRARALEGDFIQAEKKVNDTHDYKAACEQVKASIPEIQKLAEVLKQASGFDALLGMAEEDHAKEKQRVEVQLAELAKQGGDTTPFLKQLGDAEIAWRGLVNSFIRLKPSEFDAQQTIVLRTFTKIAVDIDTLRKDPVILKGSQDKARTGKEAALQSAIATAMKESQELLKLLKLEGVDAGEIDKLRVKIDAIKTDVLQKAALVPVLTDEAVKQLQTDDLNTPLQALKDGDFKKVLDAHKLAIKAAADKAKLDVVKARASLDKLEKANADAKPFIQTLRDRLLDCEGLIEGTLMKGVKQGADKLTTLLADITALETGAPPQGAPQGTPPAKMEEVEKKIKALEKLIDNSVLKECLPTRHKVFEFRIDKKQLPTDCRKVAPTEAMKTLNAFEQEVRDAIAQAETNKGIRNEIVRKADGLKKTIEADAALKKAAPNLVDSLQKRLLPFTSAWYSKNARAITENGEATAGQELKAVELLLKDVAQAPNRDKLELKATQDIYASAQAKAEWEAISEVYEKNEKRQAKARYDEAKKEGGPNEELYEEIGELYDLAVKAAKKDDFSTANDKLKEARAAFSRFMDSPLNTKVTERNKLNEINKGWQTAVSQYFAGLTALKAELTKESKDNNSDVKDLAAAAIPELDPISRLFDPGAFNEVVKALTNDDADLKKRRTFKEAGLRYLRQYRKVLESNQVLAYVKENPFVKFSTKDLEQSLKNFELGLLRA